MAADVLTYNALNEVYKANEYLLYEINYKEK